MVSPHDAEVNENPQGSTEDAEHPPASVSSFPSSPETQALPPLTMEPPTAVHRPEKEEESIFTSPQGRALTPADNMAIFTDDMDDHGAVARSIKRTRRRRLGVFVVCAAFLGIIGYFLGSFIMDQQKAPRHTTAPQDTATATEAPGVEANPVAALYPKAPQVLAGKTTVTLSRGVLRASSGETLTVKSGALRSAARPCVVMEATDFCLAARGTVAGKAVDLYFLKDGAHSRLFENPKSFQKVSVKGAVGAGTLPLNTGTVEAPAVAALTKSGAAWLAVAPQKTLTGPALASALTLS